MRGARTPAAARPGAARQHAARPRSARKRPQSKQARAGAHVRQSLDVVAQLGGLPLARVLEAARARAARAAAARAAARAGAGVAVARRGARLQPIGHLRRGLWRGELEPVRLVARRAIRALGQEPAHGRAAERDRARRQAGKHPLWRTKRARSLFRGSRMCEALPSVTSQGGVRRPRCPAVHRDTRVSRQCKQAHCRALWNSREEQVTRSRSVKHAVGTRTGTGRTCAARSSRSPGTYSPGAG